MRNKKRQRALVQFYGGVAFITVMGAVFLVSVFYAPILAILIAVVAGASWLLSLRR